MTIKTIDDLFNLAIKKNGNKGAGSVHIASLLGLNQYSIERWRDYGVVPRHWAALVAEYDVTNDELYKLTEAIKKGA